MSGGNVSQLTLGLVRSDGQESALALEWLLAEGAAIEGDGFVAFSPGDGLARLVPRPSTTDETAAESPHANAIRLSPRSCWFLKVTVEMDGAPLKVRVTDLDERAGPTHEWVTLHVGACAVPIFTGSDHLGVTLAFAARKSTRFRLSDLRWVEAVRTHELCACLLCGDTVTRSEMVPFDEMTPPARKQWICPECRKLSLREQDRQLLLHALAGDEVHCPVCGGHFKTFLPWGGRHGRPRANARCPSCLSLERHRLLWMYFERYPEVLAGTRRLMHVAPEPCSYERLKAIEGLEYLPCDLHMDGYHYGSDVLNVDITRPPFPDAWFDGVICSHVLEHVTDDRLALREIFRVLEPGGWAIIMVPVTRGLARSWEDPTLDTAEARAASFGQWDHVRAYGRDYEERIVEAGFVQDPHELEALESRATRFRHGLNEEGIRLWRKPNGLPLAAEAAGERGSVAS